MKKFFIGVNDRLLIIKEKDDGYSLERHLEGKKINQIAVDPQDEKHIYVATNNHGLWRTEDGGNEWIKVGGQILEQKKQRLVNIRSFKITSVAVSPIRKKDGSSVIYLGTEPSHLFYSEDKGENWVEFRGIQKLSSKENWSFPPRPETHYVRWIAPSYSNKNYLAISIEAGAVIHTENHGVTWKDRAPESPIDVHTLLTHPSSPDQLYAANGDGASNSKKAYAESRDGGLTWNYMSEGLAKHPYLYHMILNSRNPNERLVSASKNASAAHREPRYSTIYRKTDEGHWIEVADGLPRDGAYTHHLAEDPSTPGAYYALNNEGIYYLQIDATHWEKLPIDAVEKGLNQRAYSFVVKKQSE